MTNPLRIRAVEDRLHTLTDPRGFVLARRYAGRDKKGRALPDGELVPDCAHHRRALARGDIEEVKQ